MLLIPIITVMLWLCTHCLPTRSTLPCLGVAWAASTRTRLVLNQPIFHDRSRVVLLGAESYTRALGYHGSAGSRASLMVVSADSLEPVCSCPSNRVGRAE